MDSISDVINRYVDGIKTDFLNKKIRSEAAVKTAKSSVDEQRYKLKFSNGTTKELQEAESKYAEKVEAGRQKHQEEADERYEIKTWFTKCMGNSQSFRGTHIAKFNHSAISGVNPPLYFGNQVNDGYMKSGNVTLVCPIDVAGDAVLNQYILEFYHLLNLDFGDCKIIHLFENSHDDLKNYIDALPIDFEILRSKAIHHFYDKFHDANTDQKANSDGLLKQVYFPVADGYHLLSLVTASNILTELRQRILAHKFGADEDQRDVKKYARSCRSSEKPKYTEHTLEDYPNLYAIGYGGTKPQNISVLNSQNGGVTYLLPSIPPQLKKRDVPLPKHDFFNESLRLGAFRPLFFELHGYMARQQNNMDIRQKIELKLKEIIDAILTRAFSIRETYAEGWSEAEHYHDLPQAQRIWLDNFYSSSRTESDDWATGRGKREKNYALTREDDDMWMDSVIDACAQWMIKAYQKILSTKAYSLGDDEFIALRGMIDEALTNDKELFV